MNDFYLAEKELIDIINENNELTGEKEDLREAHLRSLWHRASHVWIYNGKGEVLLEKRAAIKHYFPSLLDISTAGHQMAGEAPIICAVREAKEELGLRIDPKDLDFLETRKMSIPIDTYMNNEYYYVYLYRWDGDISTLKLRKEEIEKVKFLPLSKFEEEVHDDESYKKYVPHKKDYYYMIIREIKRRLNEKH